MAPRPQTPRANRSDLAELPRIFARYPDVEAVFLFGSRARGDARPDSDIDLGIVPASPGLRERRLDLLADLAAAGYCRVDLVFLDTDDPVLQHEALRLHRLIYAREGFDHGSYASRIIRRYLDFVPYLEVQRQAYKRRVLGGAQERSEEAPPEA